MAGDGEALPGFDALFEHAACGLVLTLADGSICRANATFCRWIGRGPQELVGVLRIQDLLTVGGRVFHQTHWAPLLQMQGSVAEVKLDVSHNDGHAVPMLLNAVRHVHCGVVYHELALMVVADRHLYERELLQARRHAESALAARQDAQRALQESQDVLGLAMRSARMGVWSRDIDGNRVWWSRELEELFGLAPGEFEGTEAHFLQRVHEDDRAAVLAAVSGALANATDYVVEFRMHHARGEWRWMEGRGRAFYNQAGRPVTLYGLGLDITERRLAENQLRELNERLSRADRRKDEFLATLAHELRNPLAPMRNVIELLKRKDIDDPQLRWSRDVLERQLTHMTHLVNDLLDVSRITEGKVELRKQRIDAASAISAAVEAATPSIEAGEHELIVTLPHEPLWLDADPTRITQVLLNVLNNAAKYTPQGGKVRLHARAEDSRALISVRDTGIGIRAEHLSRVFDMFSQPETALERSQGGLGIGLALSRGMVELHGGSLSAASEGAGQGSEFLISLPLAAAPLLPAPVPEPPKTAAGAQRTRRVLVVDDNEDAADTLAMLLTMQGHEVTVAQDGPTALRLAGEARPDIVLLDIGLPGLNGYEVAQRLRQAPGGTAIFIVALTGWGQAHDKQAAWNAGFDRHLTKPIDLQALDAIFAAPPHGGPRDL